ncbi:MAG: hypothetical protein KDM63_00650 [Verrucomicrobiae bacterium]|nr:hypothetical protein [Verrucomicrobiae bacterium]MCB1085526.1 hypothetical protein [Verrucomicrobiae bacterium]MCB1091983.1 hypothetical protein [Verrucomicrobiae bacterium]
MKGVAGRSRGWRRLNSRIESDRKKRLLTAKGWLPFPTMPVPQPAPIDPAELPELARSVIRKAKFPLQASMVGDLALRRSLQP